MIHIEGKPTYSIYICDRVQLYVNESGFLFTTKTNKKSLSAFEDWGQWKYYWKLYDKDGIKDKIKNFLRGRSDFDKCTAWYQGLNFQEAIA